MKTTFDYGLRNDAHIVREHTRQRTVCRIEPALAAALGRPAEAHIVRTLCVDWEVYDMKGFKISGTKILAQTREAAV